MHPLIKEVYEKGTAIGLNNNQIAEHVDVAKSAFQKWLQGSVKIQKGSLKKVKKTIERMDNGEITGPKYARQLPVTYKKLPKNLSESQKRMYRLIQKLEIKHKVLTKSPEDDEDLRKLNEHVERMGAADEK